VPVDTVTTNGRATPETVPETSARRDDDALRSLAVRHLELVRKFKLSLAVYVLSMLVLTPIWIVTQYETADGWLKHLSSRSRYPGDWDPWIIWVALIGAVIVAIEGFRAYFARADTEGEIEREIERLRSRA
jgi:NADH:ubiquinone oxidoreductase subunit 5 (subunit L)/multisubunit Na+/H+ antiporter MnhA subunit